MHYINEQSSFEEFILEARKSSSIAIDTEFIREKTYYPKLCLIQFAIEEEAFIVDPLFVKDLTPLADLLRDTSTVKVFHAASQDIEILYNVTKALPIPLFDTQIAASFLGQTYQIGLAALVNSFCNVSLKKSDSLTDWSRRPLTRSQLDYAMNDVIYLIEIYRRMTKMLEEAGRLEWIDADFQTLLDEDQYIVDPYDRYRHLKRGNQLSRRQLSAARELACWREVKAQQRNIPRRWVLSDEQIVEACKRETRTISDLFLLRGFKNHVSTKDAREIVEAIKRGLDLPERDWPLIESNSLNEPNVDIALDLMNALLRLRSKENDIAIQILALQSDLLNVARRHFDRAQVMKGWRYDLVGKDLEKLIDGKIELKLDDNELIVNQVHQTL